MAVVQLLFGLFPRHDDSFGVCDDDVVAGLIVSLSVDSTGFVLAHEEEGRFHSELAKDLLFCIQMVPVSGEGHCRLCGVGRSGNGR